jgi:Flp pilus assembly pilin Flp
MAERRTVPQARAATGFRNSTCGQASIEFALIYGAVAVPLIFGTVFLAQLLWVWHSIAELTRDGARYAATHCYTDQNGSNVIEYMQTHVPPNLQVQQFEAGGSAQMNVSYSSVDAQNGVTDFACAANSASCVPDLVSVSVTNYQFQPYSVLLRSVTMPGFLATQAIGSAGLDETGQPGACP